MLFDFDSFSARMRDLAQTPYVPASFVMPEGFDGLGYDSYRLIQFRPDRGHWADEDFGYQVQAFHLGWLYPEPVRLFEIRDGVAEPIAFRAGGFRLSQRGSGPGGTERQRISRRCRLSAQLPAQSPRCAGRTDFVSGRQLFPGPGPGQYLRPQRPRTRDQFLGAGAEEFPSFSEFYLERPTGAGPLVVYAAMQTPERDRRLSVRDHAGRRGSQETTIDVTARLYFRDDVGELGVAPLTSMFLFAAVNRGDFDDYRPQVHDSNGLMLERESGEVIWRALNNTASAGQFLPLGEQSQGLRPLSARPRLRELPGCRRPLRAPPLRSASSRVGDWGQGMCRG